MRNMVRSSFTRNLYLARKIRLNNNNSIRTLTFPWCLVFAGHFSKCFTYINSETQETAFIRMSICPVKCVDK